MDWKILAASFAALVIVSSILLGGFGLGNFFSDIISTIGEFLGSSPFSGTQPSSSDLAVSIVLYPSEFSLKTEHGINLSIGPETGSVNLEMFDGEISVDYQNDIISFRPENTELSIDLPLQDIMIENLRLSKISVEEMSFVIDSESSGKTTGEGSMEIRLPYFNSFI